MSFNDGGFKPAGLRTLSVGNKIPDSEVDYFEGGDLTEYDQDDSNIYNASTAVVYEGTYSAELSNDGYDSANMLSTEGSGLNYYPQMGDDFHTYVNMYQREVTYRFVFFTETRSGSDYEFSIDFANNEIVLDGPNSNGSTGVSDLSNHTQEWLRAFVTTDSATDEITGKLFDSGGSELGSVTVTDAGTKYRGIGHGYKNSGTDHLIYVDSVEYKA